MPKSGYELLQIGQKFDYFAKKEYNKCNIELFLSEGMKVPKEKKIYYYTDELNDDFADNSKIETVKIDKNFKYIHRNVFWNIGAFIVYRVIFYIPAFIYGKIKFGLKIKNRKVIREYLKTSKKGYFVYQNHTQEILDTFLPSFIAMPTKAYIVANADNVSIKGLKTANQMMGALPVPEDIESTKNFLSAIQYVIDKKKEISIYPEAHVWPYYTGIRKFKDVSFKYPVKYDVPAFSATTVYKKSKNLRGFKTYVYVDGPFYKDKTLSNKEAQEKLYKEVYETMVKRAKESDIEIITYKKNEG